MAEYTRSTSSDLAPIVVSTAREFQRTDPDKWAPVGETDLVITSTGRIRWQPFLPFLRINGVIFPVKLAEPTHQEILIGSQRRTFNGTFRSGVRRRMRTFQIVTPLMEIDDAHRLLRILQSRPPLDVEGGMFHDQDPLPFPALIGAVNGGYHRGGEVDAREGREHQLMDLQFELIPQKDNL